MFLGQSSCGMLKYNKKDGDFVKCNTKDACKIELR